MANAETTVAASTVVQGEGTPRRRRWVMILVAVLAAMVMFMVAAVWTVRSHDIAREVERAGGRHHSYSFVPITLRVTNALFGTGSLLTHQIAFTPGQVSDGWLQRNRDRLQELPIWTLELRGTQVTDAGIAALEGNTTLLSLKLAKTRLTDASVDSINRLPSVSQLDISCTGITGEGVARLSRPDWASLTVDSSQLTGPGWDRLAGLTTCNGLGLYEADDALVARLDQIPFQYALTLHGKNVTSASIPALHQLIQGKRLLAVQLVDTSLTEADISGLRQEFPNCYLAVMTSERRERISDTSKPGSNTRLW